MDIHDVIDISTIDWSKPVRWNTGEPCQAERVSGFILITLGETYPKALNDMLAHKHFKDSVVVYEDNGVPTVSSPEYNPGVWVENVDDGNRPEWESLFGSF